MQLTKIYHVLMIVALSSVPILAQQDGGEAVPPPPSLFGGNFLFIMVAMIAIIYFVMIRPEQKRQKERQSMLSALKKGDKVLTVGGIVGVITSVKDLTYVIKSGDGAVLEITKTAVQNVMGESKAAGGDSKDDVKDTDRAGGKENR